MSSDFNDQPAGTPLVRFKDGSAIVKGDGSPEEIGELRTLLEQSGCEPGAVEGISTSLLSQGLTLAVLSEDDPRAVEGGAFASLADYIGSQN